MHVASRCVLTDDWSLCSRNWFGFSRQCLQILCVCVCVLLVADFIVNLTSINLHHREKLAWEKCTVPCRMNRLKADFHRQPDINCSSCCGSQAQVTLKFLVHTQPSCIYLSAQTSLSLSFSTSFSLFFALFPLSLSLSLFCLLSWQLPRASTPFIHLFQTYLSLLLSSSLRSVSCWLFCVNLPRFSDSLFDNILWWSCCPFHYNLLFINKRQLGPFQRQISTSSSCWFCWKWLRFVCQVFWPSSYMAPHSRY